MQIGPYCFTRSKLLVSDFDGTITDEDFYQCVLDSLGDQANLSYWDDYTEGRLTHFDALNEIFSQLKVGRDELLKLADKTGVDEHLAGDIKRLQEAGWDVVIVSAGSSWYINYLLKERGIEVAVVSNPGDVAPEGCLRMSRDRESPFYSHDVGVDKPGVVRWALANFETVAFAGDGRPDEPAADLVLPELRFARGWLASHFEEQGTPFRRFTKWTQVAEALVTSRKEY